MLEPTNYQACMVQAGDIMDNVGPCFFTQFNILKPHRGDKSRVLNKLREQISDFLPVFSGSHAHKAADLAQKSVRPMRPKHKTGVCLTVNSLPPSSPSSSVSLPRKARSMFFLCYLLPFWAIISSPAFR